MMGLFGKRGHGSTRHKLGFNAGVVIEDHSGAATFVPASGTGTFTVPIAAVQRFVVTQGSGGGFVTLRVLGEGVDLAEVDIPALAAEPLQAWFRAHPSFGGR